MRPRFRLSLFGVLLVLASFAPILSPQPAVASYAVEAFDCDGDNLAEQAGSWAATNCSNALRLLMPTLRVVRALEGDGVAGDGWASLDFLGAAVSIASVYVEAGVEPLDLPNLVLGLACHRIVKVVVPPAPDPAASLPPGHPSPPEESGGGGAAGALAL